MGRAAQQRHPPDVKGCSRAGAALQQPQSPAGRGQAGWNRLLTENERHTQQAVKENDLTLAHPAPVGRLQPREPQHSAGLSWCCLQIPEDSPTRPQPLSSQWPPAPLLPAPHPPAKRVCNAAGLGSAAHPRLARSTEEPATASEHAASPHLNTNSAARTTSTSNAAHSSSKASPRKMRCLLIFY